MKIEGAVALVTGANRGLGAAFARGLVAAGAAKVYAAARDPATVTLPHALPVRLDVTRPEQVTALARELTDVTLLVNNAGIAELGPLPAPGSGGYSASKAAAWALGNALRQELKAHRTGLLAVHAAFIDTDMARGALGPKLAPDDLVRQTLAALEAEQPELLADAPTREVHHGLAADPPVYLGLGS